MALLAALAVLAIAPSAHAQACANPIACENAQTAGVVPLSSLATDGDDTIMGFATDISVNKGQTINFKIKTDASAYTIDIFRIGWYGGNGGRLIAGNIPKSASLPQSQPSCETFSPTGLIDCGNWAVSASWTVPTTAVTGVYMARIRRADNNRDNQIIFIVRDDSSHADMAYQTSDETWEAYNTYGGNSLYQCTVNCPSQAQHGYTGASKVSYNRPLVGTGQNTFWYDELAMVRFVERNGYDVSYSSGLDTHRAGSLLTNHKLFISSGHDEYWTGQQRANVLAARNAGMNLAFFSGNEMYWRTRWEPSASGTSTPNRTLVTYKDTHYDARVDPVEWTGTFRDPRFTTAADGITPENSLIGQLFLVNSGTSRITVPGPYGALRFWRNTDAEGMTPAETLQLAPGTLGYEWDVDADNDIRPAGAFRLSSTTVSGVEAFLDYGSETDPNATVTHNMTLYKAPSGALVFGAGTVQWSWGLDSESPQANIPDANMQQATVNLFADMGVQPATLMTGIVRGTKSTDTTPPTATLSAPSSVADSSLITLSGTASDAGGGVVAGVEISTDGGSTWHPATTGTTSWTYKWIAHGAPSTVIKVRATDDSGNIGAASAGTSVDVTCPCSIMGPNVSPATAAQRDGGDPQPVELGVKFKSDVLGTVSGVRFYKAATNTGTHVGSLWSSTGERLASASFSNESGSGWQTVTFANPVTIQPNTTYVASYFAPNGHYSGTNDYYWRTFSPGPLGGGSIDSGPLHAIRSPGSGSSVNGVYAYGAFSTFPTNSYKSTAYWVDINFSPTPPPGKVTNVVAVSGGFTSANLTWNAPSTGGEPSNYRVTPYIGSTAQTATTVSAASTSATVTGLTTGTTYTFRVEALNANGTGPASDPSNAVTPTSAVAPSAPTGVAAKPATSQAQVTWTAASSNGDSPITSQTVIPYIGSTPQTPVQVSASATSATITGLTNGSDYTFRVKATNAIGDSPQSSPSSAVTPQSTLFDFQTPTSVDGGDTFPVELGVKFKADNDGFVTGVRFYKATANTGTHTGTLWAADGTKLASATFSNETPSGWQTVTFASPVAVTAGTTYTASYFTQSGHNSFTSNGLNFSIDSGPLHTLSSALTGNGVYAMAGTSTFPTSTYNSTNYWVDVMFALPKPGQVTGVAAVSGGRTSASLTWSAPASGGPVSSYRITPYVGTTGQTPTTVGADDTAATVTGLTTGTTYTFRVEAVNANGAGTASAASNAVTPLNPVVPPPPTNVSARPATNSAQVSWTLPASDGDSPITSQTVTPYIGSTPQTPMQVSAGTTSATVTGLTNGSAYTFRIRATNGIGDGALSNPSNSVTPQSTLFNLTTPTNADSGDNFPVELGMKFKADYDGFVTGVRFYKSSANTGTHVGNLWATDGTRLATATFSNETASGWQTVTFASPVAITAGTTYVASYFTQSGHNAYTSNGLASQIDTGPLHSIASSVSANGVYVRASSSTFPSGTYNSTNYWVDVMYAIPVPGKVTGVTASAAGLTSANVSWTAPSTGGPVSSYRITPYAGTTAQTPKTVPASQTATTMSGLANGTTYTFRVEAMNANGPGTASDPSNAVTPLSAVAPTAPSNVNAVPATNSALISWTPGSDGDSAITSQTVTPFVGSVAQTPVQVSGSVTSATISGLINGTSYTFRVTATNAIGTSPQSTPTSAVVPQSTLFDFALPTTVDSGDAFPVELGMKFKADYDGFITGVRFYKSAANTGTHIGNLWAANGTRLATATFTGESATGWQTVTFSSPVAVTAGTTYVASYHTDTGHNSFTSGGLASPIDHGPLHSIAGSVSANGVYAMGSSAFPSNSYNSSNYWVDVMYAIPVPGQVTGVSAVASGRTSAQVSWTAPSSGGPVASYRVTPYIGTTAQAPTSVPATADTSTTITGLTNGSTYTFKVEAVNANGAGPASAASNAVTPLNAVVPASPTNVTARPATSSALVTWTPSGSDGDSAITGQTVTPYIGATAQTPVQVGPTATSATITGLTNGSGYTFRVKATNAIGDSAQSAASNSVTPNATLFDFATPTTIDSGDTSPVELGVKFTADVDGWITGVRFYKATTNIGTHIGNVWATDGTRLATATFSNETASGWQTVTFASPVPVSAGTTYIASYFAPNAHNSYTASGFSAAFDHAPLHTLANSVSPNGVYAAGSSAFPSSSYNATNYWVDVLFAPLTQ